MGNHIKTFVVELLLLIGGQEDNIKTLAKGATEKEAIIQAIEFQRHDQDSEIDEVELSCDDVEYRIQGVCAVEVTDPQEVETLLKYL